MKQNIYDNPEFFEGYKKVRENENSANNIEEKPALFKMLPDLRGKSVLDLGCGYGENCKTFSQIGASSIIGIDISKRMLEVANNENQADNIIYKNMCIEDISCIKDKFDVVVSSLAVHYVSDFDKLAKDVYSLLSENGIFIFSQEHPITTAPKVGVNWVENNNQIEYFCLSDYSISGRRDVSWIVKNVIKYHRTFSDILNSLITAGFKIDCIQESVVSGVIINTMTNYSRCIHVPDFLFVKSIKNSIINTWVKTLTAGNLGTI